MNSFTVNHSIKLTKTPLALAFAALFLNTAASALVVSANPVQAFYNSENYTYCDAKLLSAYWGNSPWDAKVRAGNKALNNEYTVIEDYLRSARNYAVEHNVRCTWDDGNNPDYSYDDAKQLANYWGKATPWDAKLKIGTMLQDGDNKLVIEALNRARRGG